MRLSSLAASNHYCRPGYRPLCVCCMGSFCLYCVLCASSVAFVLPSTPPQASVNVVVHDFGVPYIRSYTLTFPRGLPTCPARVPLYLTKEKPVIQRCPVYLTAGLRHLSMTTGVLTRWTFGQRAVTSRQAIHSTVRISLA